MTDPLGLVSASAMGFLLGAFFFGGLWWTVRRGVASERVALWFFGSMLLRTGVVMLGFYFLMGDSWQRLLAGLFGFVLARMAVTRLTGQAKVSAREAEHAP
ncbi:MAG TPA: ATP synthase subunit I [Gallionella sp.]|nr:ATP synthase subunit I [Gallionella sp.]